MPPTTLATAVTLTGPTLPGLGAVGAPANWMLNPGNGLWTPTASLTAIAGQLTGAPSGTAVAALVQAWPSATAGGLALPSPSLPMMMGLGLAQTPPALAGVAAGPTLTPTGYANLMTPGYAAGFSSRGWLGPQANPALIGPNGYAGPWTFLNALETDLAQAAKAANAAYSGALGHFSSQSVGQAQAVFEAAVARVQGVPTNNLFVYVDEAIDFVGGVVNALTAGLASRLVGAVWSEINALTGVSLSSLVNTSSSAYAAGGVAGQVLGLVLMAVPGLGGALMAVQAVGMGLNAADAFARGDTATGFLDLEGALLAGVGAAEAAEAAEGSVAVAEEGAGGLGAQSDVPEMMQEMSAGTGPPGAVTNLTENPATARLPQEGIGEYEDNTSLNEQCETSGACFAARTGMFMRRGAWIGWMAVEKIRKGDYVWAKPEGDPGAPGEWKLVVEVFSRTAPIREVRLPGGRVIRTTNEHPFYARPMWDWLRAGSLKAGDELTGMGGEWTAVLAVEDTGRWERVYNVQVADHHTYFIGGADWGFSVWRTTRRHAR